MRLIYLIALVLYFPVHDLISAWLFGNDIFTDVLILRYVRDFSVTAIALYSLLQFRTPQLLRTAIWLYLGLIGAYVLAGFISDMDRTVVAASAGTLLIPMLLSLTGHFCLGSSKDYLSVARLIVLIGCGTSLFGMYDIQHTDFWLQTIHFDVYHRYVKMTEIGLSPLARLPWNFFADLYEDSRRAAGLFAAPLAQGHFLAVALAVSVALYSLKRNVVYVLACALITYGIWQTGTRGGMLVATLTVVGLSASLPVFASRKTARWIGAGIVAACVLVFLLPTIETSANLADSSSLGHWAAFTRNIEDIPSVLLVGEGLGSQGAYAASQQSLRDMLVGGGEGAIFTIAFQLGLPAALLFLSFLWLCFRTLNRCDKADAPTNSISQLMKWLLIGFSSSLVLSDTLLTFSGSAAFWLLLGGAVRLAAAPLSAENRGAAAIPHGRHDFQMSR